MDVLRALENVPEQTPHDAYVCPTVTRKTVAAAVAEIKRLREQLAGFASERDASDRPLAKPARQPTPRNIRG